MTCAVQEKIISESLGTVLIFKVKAKEVEDPFQKLIFLEP